MITIDAFPGSALRLGYSGEHYARRIRFDIADWEQIFGEGEAVLLVRRFGDDFPYIASTSREGSFVYWIIQRRDVQFPGAGECELRYVIGDTVVKDERWITMTEEAMDEPGGDPDAPEVDYITQVLHASEQAANAAQSAEESAGRAEAAAKRAENAAGSGGGVYFETDETLILKDGILGVNTADEVEADNSLPITSAAVHVQVGNIEALLKTI
jgi:hypothetical protein